MLKRGGVFACQSLLGSKGGVPKTIVFFKTINKTHERGMLFYSTFDYLICENYHVQI